VEVLIIPALLFFANLPMKQAVGTSLFIIFINSLIGFGGDLIGGVELNYKLLFIISAMLFWDAYRNSNIQKN
jgi:uncharacterized membrane protein YfcA